MGGAKRKYRNVPTVVDGVRFASKAEALRDGELQLLQKVGRIRNLKRQPRFSLKVNGKKVTTYVGDWSYEEDSGPTWNAGIRYPDWRSIVEDRKGVQTPAFKIKWALAKALHPEIEWRLS